MGNITTQTAAESLAMVVLPKTAWEGVVAEIQELKNILQKKSEEEVNNQWIESTQARKCWVYLLRHGKPIGMKEESPSVSSEEKSM